MQVELRPMLQQKGSRGIHHVNVEQALKFPIGQEIDAHLQMHRRLPALLVDVATNVIDGTKESLFGEIVADALVHVEQLGHACRRIVRQRRNHRRPTDVSHVSVERIVQTRTWLTAVEKDV